MRINNEVLDRLWNDPDVRELTDSSKEIMPSQVSEGELVIDYDHLVEGGYVGEPRIFIYGSADLPSIARALSIRDYWIRLKLPRGKRNSLYSLFKR